MWNSKSFLFGCLLVTFLASWGASAPASANLIKFPTQYVSLLDDKSFFSAVEAGNPFLLMVYAPWCQHCRELKPTWDTLGKELGEINSPVSVRALDGTASRWAARKLGVDAYPTLYSFNAHKYRKYNGTRELEDLKVFSLSSKADGKEWLEAPKAPSVTERLGKSFGADFGSTAGILRFSSGLGLVTLFCFGCVYGVIKLRQLEKTVGSPKQKVRKDKHHKKA